ncbi:hypothetical protein PISL3812_02784 [Talaromyces islandicus]|uniref:Uncharacterized protein n=1 Tax=Talaromyces islandicus TaxID=28573 RepID=A0A0U1LRL3_TALIS|nr:hypothetical protein PISL3812_02784 [Talaromyces islandicus]
MKSTLTLATVATLAGLLATGVTAEDQDPYLFVAFVQSDDPLNHDYMFSPGIQVNGDTLIHLGHGGLFFYVDDSTSQLVMTADNHDIIGNAWIDTNDRGILKFSNDPDAHDYALFTRDYDDRTNTLLPQGADDLWFWCPLDDAEVNGTVAVGQVAGDGCEQLKGVQIAYGD